MLPPIPRQKAKNVHLTASPHRPSVPPTITANDRVVSRDVTAILTGIHPLPTSDNTPTRIFKATQAASITAIVECTVACRHLIPGLAELMKDRQAGGVAGLSNFHSKNFLLSSGSDVVSTNELLLNQYTSMMGGQLLDDRQAALLTLGHPSLPSLQMVSNSASKGVNEYPPFMTMSVRDSAPQLKLEDPPKVVIDDEMEGGEEEDGSNDSKQPQLDVQRKFVVKGGMKGYRMSRSTKGVTTGCYYYEAIILGGDDEKKSTTAGRGVKRTIQNVQENTAHNESNKQSSSSSSMNNGHLRIGWCTRSGDLQAPVGYNEHSYAIRDISGSRIHQSRREDKWADGVSFGPGDVIGFSICLVKDEKDGNASSSSSSSNAPTTTTSISKESAEERRRKSEGGGSQDSDMSIDDDGGGKSSSSSSSSKLTNHIRFFKNGMPLGEKGIGFDNVIPGKYHPAISCYLDGSAQMNFGPHFVYPPQGLPNEITLRPISDICPPPPPPEEAIEKIMIGEEGKKSFFTKKMDDNILSVFKELARLEVTSRYFAYTKHLDLHRLEIGALRKDRGLSTGTPRKERGLSTGNQ